MVGFRRRGTDPQGRMALVNLCQFISAGLEEAVIRGVSPRTPARPGRTNNSFADSRNPPKQPADPAHPPLIPRSPGGKLRYLVVKKAASSPKCGDCHIALPGVPALRPRQYAQISKRQKTVQRAYGGSRCATCVRDRIVRSFLVEEAKIVKRVIASQKTAKA